MSLDQSHYDVALFSTGLTQSILSAALSSAGLSVIHIDQNDYYADQWASLTLSELLKWAANASTTSDPVHSRRVSDVSLTFPASTGNDAPQSSISSQLPESLASLDRHYAISLAPTLLPATGPSIDCLISSKVSSYATFRLLERTCVASSSAHGPDGSGMTLTSVPASKEDIFKTKTLSLIAKRKLMKLLMYIATEDWPSELVQDPETAKLPFVDYLAQVHKMPSDLIDAVAYGVCLCSTPHETTETAMSRAKSHMSSVGRYGNSAYLVGQYGGAGELAQGYCRASAVKGGMFILAHQVRSANYDRQAAKWSIEVKDVDSTITSDYLVSSDDMLEQLGFGGSSSSSSSAAASNASDPSHELGVLHRAVAVLDKPIRFSTPPFSGTKASGSTQQDADQPQEQAQPELPPETGLVVFPPGSIGGNANTVTVLMMGEGTFSCPKGQYVYYVQTEASEAESQKPAREVLRPVLDQIVAWTSYGDASDDASQPRAQPLVELTYRQHVSSHAEKHDEAGLSRVAFPPAQAEASPTPRPAASIAGMTDAAVHQAEKVYYDILASRLAARVGGESHEDKVKWIRNAVEEQKAERKRRRGRDPSEYQGRGGRGADDGITSVGQEVETGALPVQEDTSVVGFFEVSSNQDDDDQDDADEGQ